VTRTAQQPVTSPYPRDAAAAVLIYPDGSRVIWRSGRRVTTLDKVAVTALQAAIDTAADPR
jgi:hypothetical protein